MNATMNDYPSKIQVNAIQGLITDHGGNEYTWHYVWNTGDTEAYLVYGSCSQSGGLFCITGTGTYQACFNNAVKAIDIFAVLYKLNFEVAF